MRGWVALVSLFALAATPISISAQATRPSATLPDVFASLSPAEGRALRDQITRLSQERTITERTLTAIARALQVNLRGQSFNVLLTALQERAEIAQNVKNELASLRTRLSQQNATIAGLRRENAQTKSRPKVAVAARPNPATDILTRATTAYEAGQLEEAARLLAELTPLRRADMTLKLEDWREVLSTRARVLELSGKAVEAAQLLLDGEEAFAEISRQTRAELAFEAANTLYRDAQIQTGLDRLAQIANLYRTRVLPLVPLDVDPRNWASAQNNLGVTLKAHGERLGGAAGMALLGQSVDAYRAALEVRTRATMPQSWAATQNNLGIILNVLGERTGGNAGLALLAQSADAYRAALEVRTKDAVPTDWAVTQNNLGITLQAQGLLTDGDAGLALLAQSGEAFRLAQEVFTRAAMPTQWAMTQNGLANTLLTQGRRTSGDEGLALLAQSANANRAVLEVFTRADMPVDWATTQNNLGNALSTLGVRAAPEARMEILAQSLDAYGAALEVHTLAAMPVDWARTNENIARAELAIFDISREQPALARAKAAAESAMEVYRGGGMALNEEKCARLLVQIAQRRG